MLRNIIQSVVDFVKPVLPALKDAGQSLLNNNPDLLSQLAMHGIILVITIGVGLLGKLFEWGVKKISNFIDGNDEDQDEDINPAADARNVLASAANGGYGPEAAEAAKGPLARLADLLLRRGEEHIDNKNREARVAREIAIRQEQHDQEVASYNYFNPVGWYKWWIGPQPATESANEAQYEDENEAEYNRQLFVSF